MISTLVAGMLPAKESNSLSDAMSSGCSIAHRAPHPQLVNPCAIHASSKAAETLGSPPTPEPALGGKGRREEREEGAWEVRERRGAEGAGAADRGGGAGDATRRLGGQQRGARCPESWGAAERCGGARGEGTGRDARSRGAGCGERGVQLRVGTEGLRERGEGRGGPDPARAAWVAGRRQRRARSAGAAPPLAGSWRGRQRGRGPGCERHLLGSGSGSGAPGLRENQNCPKPPPPASRGGLRAGSASAGGGARRGRGGAAGGVCARV